MYFNVNIKLIIDKLLCVYYIENIDVRENQISTLMIFGVNSPDGTYQQLRWFPSVVGLLV